MKFGAIRPLHETRKRQKHGDDQWSQFVSLDELVELGQEPQGEGGVEEFIGEFARLEDERRKQRYELSKGLPPKERELMHFFLYVYDQEKHGDSLEDAAAQYLGKSPSTVRSQVHRMKQLFAS